MVGFCVLPIVDYIGICNFAAVFYKCKVMIGSKYRVRVVYNYRNKSYEILHNDLTYALAVGWFRFYVDCTLEFGLDVHCINIFIGKKCIKLFQNH